MKFLLPREVNGRTRMRQGETCPCSPCRALPRCFAFAGPIDDNPCAVSAGMRFRANSFPAEGREDGYSFTHVSTNRLQKVNRRYLSGVNGNGGWRRKSGRRPKHPSTETCGKNRAWGKDIELSEQHAEFITHASGVSDDRRRAARPRITRKRLKIGGAYEKPETVNRTSASRVMRTNGWRTAL